MISNNPKPALFLLLSASAILYASALYPDTVYKSVDEKGKVTYSSAPPSDEKKAIIVDLAPPPSAEQIETAKQRHESNQKAADILDENRQTRDAQIARENRIKREKQNQLQLQRQADNANQDSQQDFAYPYYRRGTSIIVPPRPPVTQPPVHLPATPVPR